MKKLLFIAIALLTAIPSMAQTPKFHNDYYDCRMAAYAKMPIPKNAMIWIGDSIVEQAWWESLTKEKDFVNRGIGGDNTYGMLHRLPLYLEASPRKIFIFAGINDISANYPIDDVYANFVAMVKMIQEKAPECEIFIQSPITPNNDVLAYAYVKNKQDKVTELNTRLEQMCHQMGVTWVDIRPVLHNEKGEIKEEYTKDGIHLYPAAYEAWVDYLKKMKYLRK
ncbi:MAG: GDSL-type esterase/lipase family protein [Alistipes sp.]|nr:GDSL-type esterase/lipase family protein [Alistipes sp.]